MRSWHDDEKTVIIPATLHAAAKGDDIAQLARLVDDGADIDEKNANGYSPLMLAVYAGSRRTAQALLRLGANPESPDFGGSTVLMGAAFKGHIELMEMLIDFGADIHAKNASGLTAYDFAMTFGRTQAAELLVARGVLAHKSNRIVNFLKMVISR